MAKNTKKRAIIYSNVKENKKIAEERKRIRDNQINLNDEVIIGFNEQKKAKHSSNTNHIKNGNTRRKKNGSKTNRNLSTKEIRKSTIPYNSDKKAKVNPQKRKKTIFRIRATFVVLILAVGVIVFLNSSFFDIDNMVISIENNSVLTEQEIMDLSNIVIGQNIFSINKSKSIENIKTNTYVESVKIKRALPDKLNIMVIERQIKFQLESMEDGIAYIYVDNQGIAVDKSTEKKDCITVVGYETNNVQYGERLNEEDLEGLSAVNLILQVAKNYGIEDRIDKIDISNHDDYLIHFSNDGKIAHLGDVSSVNDKMTRIKRILEINSDYQGEIFVNVDLNNGEYPYFRESV